MKQLSRTIAAAAAACMALSGGAQAADVVITKSGDRLSGTVVTLSEGKLTFKTSYAGKIVIAWDEVASLETESSAKFKLRDGTVLDATARSSGAESSVVLKSGAIITTAPIAMTDVAYINPPPEVTGDGVSVSGIANLGFTANRGNTDNSQLFYAAETIARGVSNRFTIGAVGEQKEENGAETARRNRAYLKYDHFLTTQWYTYANADMEEDKFKDLNLRSSLGVGGGYQVWESPQRNLSVEAGGSYVNNDQDVADDESYAAGRWATRYDQYVFGGKTQFFHQHEGLFDLSDPANLILRAQTGLRFPLIERLNATLQYNIEWRKEPPLEVKKFDHAYIMSLGYTW